MALIRLNLQIAHFFSGFKQGVNYFSRSFRWEPPIRTKRNEQKFAAAVGERLGQIALVIYRGIEVVQGLGHQQIRIGVEIL